LTSLDQKAAWAAPLHRWWRSTLADVPWADQLPASNALLPHLSLASTWGWRSNFNWEFEHLASTFGFLECDSHLCQDRSKLRRVSLADYIDKEITRRTYPASIGSVRLHIEAARLTQEYLALAGSRNLYSHLDKDLAPCLKWLVLGPKLAVNRFHEDVWNTAAWNVLLTGAKTWLLASPAWESEIRKYVCIQKPGDVLFVPSGWRHEVLYDIDSIAITENYVDVDNAAIVSAEQARTGQVGLANLTRKLAQICSRSALS